MQKALTVHEVGTSNKARVFRLILEKGLCSRLQLAKASGLSIMTVKKAVDALVAAGIAKEEKGTSAVGRRPECVFVAQELGAIVSMDIASPIELYAVCFKVDQEIIGRVSRVIDASIPYRSNIQAFFEDIHALCGKVLGVGLSVAGAYNEEEDTVPSDAVSGYAQLHFAQLIRESFMAQYVVIAHDVHLAAQTEAKLRHTGSLVYLYFGAGVGSGIVVNGEVLSGTDQVAGEIGSVLLQDGSLSERMSTLALSQQAKRPFQELWQAFEGGDDHAAGMIEAAGKLGGLIVYNMIYLLNPAYIVIDSDYRAYADYLRRSANAFCEAHIPQAPLPANFKIEASRSGEPSVCYGLYDRILDRFTEDICNLR
ncbi:MAG: ROK family protein [Acetanaerobacterium sp.]